MEVVILYLAFLALVEISYVETSWGCKDAQCQREPNDGGPMFRPGYHVLNYKEETPYVASFQEKSSNEVFCLGVLINTDRALTTLICLYVREKGDSWLKRDDSSFSVLYGDKRVDRMQRRDVDSVRTRIECDNRLSITEIFWESCDFAIVKTVGPFSRVSTALFPAMDTDSVRDALNLGIRANRYCIGVGFGKYELWSGEDTFFGGKSSWRFSKDGRSKGDMHKFDMRLLHAYTCNDQIYSCCLTGFTKWLKYKLFEKYFKKVNCLARGKKLSQCFGESGGPIICDGYVYGLIKGTIECPMERERKSDIEGFMTYASIEHAIDFIRYEYNPTFNVDNRPVPTFDSFGVEVDNEGRPVDPESVPVLPPNITSGGGDPRSGNGTGSEAEGEDYYYGYGDYARPQMLTLIFAFFILFITKIKLDI